MLTRCGYDNTERIHESSEAFMFYRIYIWVLMDMTWYQGPLPLMGITSGNIEFRTRKNNYAHVNLWYVNTSFAGIY